MLPVKSFKEISDNCIQTGTKINLLRTAVIYGANASGKSNILKALNDFCNYIINSTELKLNQPIALYDPFLLDESTQKESSIFHIEFLLGEMIKHEYTIEIVSERVINEELLYYPKGQKVNIFKRNRTGLSILYCMQKLYHFQPKIENDNRLRKFWWFFRYNFSSFSAIADRIPAVQQEIPCP